MAAVAKVAKSYASVEHDLNAVEHGISDPTACSLKTHLSDMDASGQPRGRGGPQAVPQGGQASSAVLTTLMPHGR